MSMPVWKLKREFKRIWMQLTIAPWIAVSASLRAVFDATSKWSVTKHEGSAVVSEDIAILLIYQPNGISDSTLFTLRELLNHGYCPIVVANHSIGSRDLERLKEVSLVVIERPNYGYDFGGYRQGILHLLASGYKPNNLLVFNDSIWFPLSGDCSFLAELKQAQFDVYGLVMNDLSKNAARHHIQSYLFHFKKDVIQSDVFEQYWRRLFLSNNKLAVIRICEIKMSEYFRKAGFSVGAKFSVESLYAVMRRLSDDDLESIVNYQKLVDPRRSRIIKQYERKKFGFRKLVAERLLGKYFLIAHPIVLIRELKCPVLKKDKQYSYTLQRMAIFEEKLDGDMSEVVRAELIEHDCRPDCRHVDDAARKSNDGLNAVHG